MSDKKGEPKEELPTELYTIGEISILDSFKKLKERDRDLKEQREKYKHKKGGRFKFEDPVREERIRILYSNMEWEPYVHHTLAKAIEEYTGRKLSDYEDINLRYE